MKLPKTQQDLLDAMRAGARVVYVRYMGRFNPNAYYFRTDTNKRCTVAAKALQAKGLAVRAATNTVNDDHELVVASTEGGAS